jgi:hypothetical protein
MHRHERLAVGPVRVSEPILEAAPGDHAGALRIYAVERLSISVSAVGDSPVASWMRSYHKMISTVSYK